MVDLTLPVTPEMAAGARSNLDRALTGHVGTHFDCMDKVFPLPYLICPGIVFDVTQVADRDIEATDIEMEQVAAGMFVAFYSGYIDRVPYGTEGYFAGHPQLSHELLERLRGLGIAIIGVDFAGIRRGKEHTPTDQRCADAGVFVVENLYNLAEVLKGQRSAGFTAYTFPMRFLGTTGLPCRVTAE